MSLLRVRHPNTPPRDRDLGPESARLHPWRTMRLTVEEQLIRAAFHPAPVRVVGDRT